VVALALGRRLLRQARIARRRRAAA